MASQRRARIVRGLGVMVVFCLSTTANLSAQGKADSARRIRSDTAGQRMTSSRRPALLRAPDCLPEGMRETLHCK